MTKKSLQFLTVFVKRNKSWKRTEITKNPRIKNKQRDWKYKLLARRPLIPFKDQLQPFKWFVLPQVAKWSLKCRLSSDRAWLWHYVAHPRYSTQLKWKQVRFWQMILIQYVNHVDLGVLLGFCVNLLILFFKFYALRRTNKNAGWRKFGFHDCGPTESNWNCFRNGYFYLTTNATLHCACCVYILVAHELWRATKTATKLNLCNLVLNKEENLWPTRKWLKNNQLEALCSLK